MANIITKSDERRAHEAYVRRSFGVNENDRSGSEACEIIAARTREAVEKMDQEGEKRSWS